MALLISHHLLSPEWCSWWGEGKERAQECRGQEALQRQQPTGPSLEGSSPSGAAGHRHGICENSLISDSRSVPLRRGWSTSGAWGR